MPLRKPLYSYAWLLGLLAAAIIYVGLSRLGVEEG
jgi:cytosine/uracil/thiamine/allantoin permease